MFFDPYPKSRFEDFYDRDREFTMLRKSLDLGERLILVYGIRRIGKTSFIRVALKKLGYPHVIVDVREIYGMYNRVTRHYMYKKIADYFIDNISFFEKLGYRLRDLLGRVRGFKLVGVGVELDYTKLPDLTELFKIFNRWAIDHSTRFVIAFDEAQYLRYSGAVRYNMLFSWAMDNLENLSTIVTGSEVGVLKDFLKIDDPRAPLYGRYVCEIKLERFTHSQSIEFLEEGFKQVGVSVNRYELEEVVEILDGIPGWLTLYGYYRGVKEFSHREALDRVFIEGSRMVYAELEKIISPSRDRYLAILEAIASGLVSWSSIRSYTISKTGPISDKRFSDLLKNLIRYSIIEKTSSGYRIIDPLVRHSVQETVKHGGTRVRSV